MAPLEQMSARLGAWARFVGALLAVSCSLDSRDVGIAPATPGEDGASGNDGNEGASGVGGAAGSEGSQGGGLGPSYSGELLIEPERLDFGGVGIGSEVTASIQLRNRGNARLALAAPALTGAEADEFSIAGATCSSFLEAGSACQIDVSFGPSGEGDRLAALLIPVGGGEAARVECSGTGLDSRDLSANADQIDFGVVEVGTESAARDWLITNNGVGRIAALELGTFDSQNFRLDNGCAEGLEAGGTCRVGVTFTPREAGSRRSNVTLTSAAGAVGLSFQGTSELRVRVQVSGPGRVVTAANAPFQIDCGTLCDALLLPPFTAALQPINDTGFVFKSWVHNPDCGGTSSCAITGDTKSLLFIAEFAAPSHNLAFISSQYFTANLGSARAYDAACSALAIESRITTQPNAFIAALSDGTSDFRDRLAPGVQGWVNAAGLPVARTASEWLDDGRIFYPIQFSELGGFANPPMTGRRRDGTLDNCQDWTVADGTLTPTGSPGGGPDAWSEQGGRGDIECASFAPIICLGNTSAAPLTVPSRQGKRIWVTRAVFTPGLADPDSLCRAERPAGVSEATALLSGRGGLYPDLIEPGVDYVRPDGLVVFDGSTPKGSSSRVTQALRPLTGVWVDGAGQPIVSDIPQVWLGDLGPRSCVNWTEPSTSEQSATADYRSLPQPTGSLPCNTAAHLYCIEL